MTVTSETLKSTLAISIQAAYDLNECRIPGAHTQIEVLPK